MPDPKADPPEPADASSQILVRWFDGAMSGEEERVFKERLRIDPRFRAEFVRHSLRVQMIRRVHSAGPAGDAVPATPRRVSAPRRFRHRPALAAAAAALLLGALALLIPGRGSEKDPVIARLHSVAGTVLLSGEAGKTLAARESELHSDHRIEVVGAGSGARVTFPDGTWMALGPDTLISRIEEAGAGKRVRLVRGAIAARVTKQPAGRPMVFLTPQSEATVLGTTLRLAVVPDEARGSTRLDVEEGKVRLRNLAGKTLDVTTGHYAVAAANGDLAAIPRKAGAQEGVPGGLVVTFLEPKGHGLAIVLKTPEGRTYVIDTGNVSKDFDNGRDTIAPLLRARGVKEIDAIVISHPHSDHFGGASWLIQNMVVKKLIDNGFEGRGQSDGYRAIRKLVQERGGEYAVAHAGATLDWGKDLKVEVLSPPKEFLLLDADPAKVSEHSVLNNNSLTLRVEYGAHVFLFPGDAYGTESNYMAKNHPDKMRATVLCAPHHGFNSTPGYAKLVKPEVVVASCEASYAGEVASPADKTELIFKPVGARVLTTTWHGTIEVATDGTTYTVKTARNREGK